ncbi:hypothetical protein EI555_007716 [Monodon monoceros]|uniref:Uncharacterized protein n=1 Tax=Monodon monoceros TaxID=40151 RepID=A0A4U1EQS8_MONMO|nr:hypothetical protein EI555_007716 [Monodon monoceros]
MCILPASQSSRLGPPVPCPESGRLGDFQTQVVLRKGQRPRNIGLHTPAPRETRATDAGPTQAENVVIFFYLRGHLGGFSGSGVCHPTLGSRACEVWWFLDAESSWKPSCQRERGREREPVPRALKPAFPAAGRWMIWAPLPALLPHSGWNLRQSYQGGPRVGCQGEQAASSRMKSPGYLQLGDKISIWFQPRKWRPQRHQGAGEQSKYRSTGSLQNQACSHLHPSLTCTVSNTPPIYAEILPRTTLTLNLPHN